MKKLIVPATLLALSFTLALPAMAEDGVTVSATGGATSSIRTQLENEREKIQNEIEQNREKLMGDKANLGEDIKNATTVGAEIKSQIKDDRQNIKSDMNALVNANRVRITVATKIIDATISRFNTLIDRFNSRIDKLTQAGADTTQAVSFVDAAKANVADAEVQLTSIENLNSSLVNVNATTTVSVTASTTASTTMRMEFDQIKSLAKTAREDLTSAKQNLMRALEEIKQIEKGLKQNATSTPEANNQ